MTDSERLLVIINYEIERYKEERPFNEVVVYMTDDCRELIIQNIVCVLDETRKPPIYDKIFGCIVRRMIADGIRFAVGREIVIERSCENAE